MHHFQRSFVAASVACLFTTAAFAGISQERSDGPPPGYIPPSNSDARMYEVTRRLAGFGGVFLDDEGRINVYVVGGEGPGTEDQLRKRRQRILGVLNGVYGPALLRAPGKEDRMRELRVLNGRYDVRELGRWRDHLRKYIGNVDGLVSLDLDERRNRVVVGLSTSGAVEALAKRIEAMGIEREAVRVELVTPIVELKSVRSKFRPVIGGTQLEIDLGVFAAANCSMGFNATVGGVKGFVTNSHCSKKKAENDDAAFHQPNDPWYTEGNKIGYEMRDTWSFTGGTCPDGRKCLLSDSTFVKYRKESLFGGAHIARTEELFSREVVDDPYDVTWFSSFPVAGLTLHKVGRTTGWTRGVLETTCMDIDFGDFIKICQSEIVQEPGVEEKIADNGDSGSPVFFDAGAGNAYLAGLLHAGRTDGSSIVYSPIDFVRAAHWPMEIAVTGPPAPPAVQCRDDEYCCEMGVQGSCVRCAPKYILCPFPDIPMDFRE